MRVPLRSLSALAALAILAGCSSQPGLTGEVAPTGAPSPTSSSQAPEPSPEPMPTCGPSSFPIWQGDHWECEGTGLPTPSPEPTPTDSPTDSPTATPSPTPTPDVTPTDGLGVLPIPQPLPVTIYNHVACRVHAQADLSKGTCARLCGAGIDVAPGQSGSDTIDPQGSGYGMAVTGTITYTLSSAGDANSICTGSGTIDVNYAPEKVDGCWKSKFSLSNGDLSQRLTLDDRCWATYVSKKIGTFYLEFVTSIEPM